MGDDADRAQIEIERELERAISYRKPVPNIHPIGECHFCAEEFELGSLKLFCDSRCEVRYQRLKGIKTNNAN